MSKLCGVLARQYVDFLSGAPRLILLLAITVCGLCIPSASRFLSSTQNVYSEIAGSRSAVAREKMKEYFGHLPPESDLILVQQQREEAFAPSPNLVSSGLLVEISTMTQDFLQSRGFSDIEVDSYPVFQEQGFPHIASQLVSEDLRSALLVLRRIGVPINKTVGALESDLILELRRRYLDVSDSSLAYIGVAGIAPFVVDGSRSAAKDLARSNPICIPLCFMVLAFVVQSWRLMLITLLCMICANTVCFACLSWMADSGVVMSTSVPIMGESCLMALTFDYSLFLLVRFQEEIAIGMTHQGAVTASVRRSGHVILASGFTLCYCAMAVQQLPLQESFSLSIGILAAILCAMAVNLFITPTVLLAFPDFVASGTERADVVIHENDYEKCGPIANGKDHGLLGSGIYAWNRAAAVRHQSRAFSYDSSDEGEISSSGSSEDDLEAGFGSKQSSRKLRQMEVQKRRSQAAQRNISDFWRWWSRLCTSRPCSVLVLLLVIVVSVLAFTGPTAIHLDRSQGTMDFAMLGPEDSQTLETLNRVGKDFSEGIMGPTTLMFVASSPGASILQPAVWDSMTSMLKFIHDSMLSNGALGSIGSPMYLSSPEKMVEVKVDQALMAERTSPGPTTPTQLKELKYTMGQMLNAQRTAALALVTPNLRLTSPEATKWTRELQSAINVQNARADTPVHIYMVSQNMQMLDVEEGVFGRVPNLIIFSLVGCLVMIGLIFKSVMIAVRGLVTIVFTLAVVYMAAHGIFQFGWLRAIGIPVGGTEGLFFMVPVTTFTIVLGLALDYDIFLLGRMTELRERGLPTLDAVADGVAQTGHVITCAGLMMAIAFGGMLLSDVPGMRQLSFIFTLGVLIDTFVVRTIVTPALTAALGEANW